MEREISGPFTPPAWRISRVEISADARHGDAPEKAWRSPQSAPTGRTVVTTWGTFPWPPPPSAITDTRVKCYTRRKTFTPYHRCPHPLHRYTWPRCLPLQLTFPPCTYHIPTHNLSNFCPRPSTLPWVTLSIAGDTSSDGRICEFHESDYFCF